MSISLEYSRLSFSANGTCRSEGVVAFYLQKASDAKRKYATLMCAHATTLGLRSSSLIRYDDRLRQCILGWFKKSNIDPEKISYLEADGSGIKVSIMLTLVQDYNVVLFINFTIVDLEVM